MAMIENIIEFCSWKALHMLCVAIIGQCEVGANISFTCDNSPGGTMFTSGGALFTSEYWGGQHLHRGTIFTSEYCPGGHNSLVNSVLGGHYSLVDIVQGTLFTREYIMSRGTCHRGTPYTVTMT